MMKHFGLCRNVFAALLSAAVLFGCSSQQPGAALVGPKPSNTVSDILTLVSDEFTWHSDDDKTLQAAFEEADRDGKLLLFYFAADGCQWCRKLDDEVFTASTRVFVAKHYVPIRVDVLASTIDDEIGLRVVPALGVSSPDGSNVDMLIGYNGRDNTLLWLLSNAKHAPNWKSK